MLGTHRWIVAVAGALLVGALAPAGAGAAARPPGAGRQITVTPLTTEGGEPLDGSYVELNERGQVATVIYRTDPLQSVPVVWYRGRVTRVAEDVRYARPLDLSDGGYVVGQHYQLTEPLGVYPFSWSRGRWSRLPAGGSTGWALDVNSRGDVVGRIDGPPYTMAWDADGEPIPPPPGAGYELINDRGRVMGGVANEAGKAEAATWRLGDDEVVRLGTLGGDESRGVAINESGDITGTSLTADGEEHAFLWRDGEMIDLGTLGGSGSWPADVNDHGDVVGTAVTADGEGHAFLWRDGEMIDLGTLGAANSYPASRAVALNNRGQVVGYAPTPEGGPHAFLWEDGHITDIGVLADPEGPSQPADINDRGQIVGNLYGDWPNSAVLWTAPPGRR